MKETNGGQQWELAFSEDGTPLVGFPAKHLRPLAPNAQSPQRAGETRVEWLERRGGRAVRIIGDETESGWDFGEKDLWGVRWYPIEATPERIKIAKALAVRAGRRVVLAAA